MLDRPQGVLVHRVAVIKIADDQRINARKLREDFGQQSETLQWPERHSRVVGHKNFPKHRPSYGNIFGGQFRVHHDVRDAAFSAPAERYASAGGLDKQSEEDGAVRQFFGVEYFEQAVTDRKGLPVSGLGLCGTGYAEEALPQSLGQRGALFEISEQLTV